MQIVITQMTQQLARSDKNLDFTCQSFQAELADQEAQLRTLGMEKSRMESEAARIMESTKSRIDELEMEHKSQSVSFLKYNLQSFCHREARP